MYSNLEKTNKHKYYIPIFYYAYVQFYGKHGCRGKSVIQCLQNCFGGLWYTGTFILLFRLNYSLNISRRINIISCNKPFSHSIQPSFLACRKHLLKTLFTLFQ